MRTVYYITGLMASGKTTASTNLAKGMNLPLFHSDLVYDELHKAMGIGGRADALLDPQRWNTALNFGTETWAGHEDIYEAKAQILSKMLAGTEGDFVIEGFSLSLPKERDLVTKAVGPHQAVLLRIDMPYEKWAQFLASRWPDTPPLAEKDFRRLRGYFEAGSDDVVYAFLDPNMILAHYAPYQKEGFTDKKIEALKIPVQEGDVINDIGCNEGRIAAWCIEQGASVAHGYDYNWRFLDKARERGVIPHLGNVEHDPLETADVTICASVFHYLENPQGFIRKARAATRRLFIIELPIYADPETGKSMPDLVSKFEPTSAVNIDVTRYSAKLIETWLWRSFKKVEFVGESVPPDNSLRYVYHCSA